MSDKYGTIATGLCISRIDKTGRADYSQFRGLQCAHKNNDYTRGLHEAVEQKMICELNLVFSPEYPSVSTALVTAELLEAVDTCEHNCPTNKTMHALDPKTIPTHCILGS